ncbi:uncharacterized protein LOC144707546 [Wolffia australiana]
MEGPANNGGATPCLLGNAGRPSKRRLTLDSSEPDDNDGGAPTAATAAALRAELEQERAAAATAANEAMAMILRLEREKGLLAMELRHLRRAAEEKIAHQQDQLRSLSLALRATVSGDDEDDPAASLGRRVQALEREVRRISRRLADDDDEDEEDEEEEDTVSASPRKATRLPVRNPRRRRIFWMPPAGMAWAAFLATIRRGIREFAPPWVLSLAGARTTTGGAAAAAAFAAVLLLPAILVRLSRGRRAARRATSSLK